MNQTRDSASTTLIALVVLVAIGTFSSLAMVITGVDTGTIAAVNTPLVVVAVAAMIRRLDKVEGKVNGQLDRAREGAYSAGYSHGAEGLRPRYPVNVGDLERAAHGRRPRGAPPRP